MTTTKVQCLYPDITINRCEYCDGRGFMLIPTPDHRNHDKMIHVNSVFECKFCGGRGSFVSEPIR